MICKNTLFERNGEVFTNTTPSFAESLKFRGSISRYPFRTRSCSLATRSMHQSSLNVRLVVHVLQTKLNCSQPGGPPSAQYRGSGCLVVTKREKHKCSSDISKCHLLKLSTRQLRLLLVRSISRARLVTYALGFRTSTSLVAVRSRCKSCARR